MGCHKEFHPHKAYRHLLQWGFRIPCLPFRKPFLPRKVSNLHRACRKALPSLCTLLKEYLPRIPFPKAFHILKGFFHLREFHHLLKAFLHLKAFLLLRHQ